VIDESDLQCEKQCDPRISTFFGIIMNWIDKDENAPDSIRVKCEFDSNVTDESEPQSDKQFNPTISTFLGIKTDWSDDLEKVNDSIRVKREFDSNTIDSIDRGSLQISSQSAGRGQFSDRIESGIQARKIALLLGAHSVTGLIKPPFTTIRRS
jgi:hypothetical protein